VEKHWYWQADPAVSRASALRKTFLLLFRFLHQARQCSSCWLNDLIVSTVGQGHHTLISASNYIASYKLITQEELGIRTLLQPFWCLIHYQWNIPLEWNIWITKTFGFQGPNVRVLFYLAVLGFELRASHLLGSITWATLPALFVGIIFEIGSHFIPELSWAIIILFVLPLHSWDDRWVPPHPAIDWDGVSQTSFAWAGFNYDPPDCYLPSS
jgi:hypothetical protein